MFVNGVVQKISALASGKVDLSGSDVEGQIDMIVLMGTTDLEHLRTRVAAAEGQIASGLESLRKFYAEHYYEDVDPEWDLAKTAEFVVEKETEYHAEMEAKLSEVDPSGRELSSFLQNLLCTRVENTEDLSALQLKMETTSFIDSQEARVRDLQMRIENLQTDRTQFEADAVEYLVKVYRMFNLDPAAVIGRSYEGVCHEFVQRVSVFLKEREEINDFRPVLDTFLSQLMLALHLPIPKMKPIGYDGLKELLISIIDSSHVQHDIWPRSKRKET
jgi:hypothetical protein